MEINKIISNLNVLGVNDIAQLSKKNEVVQVETTVANMQEVDDDSQLNFSKETVTKESTSENYDFMNFSSGDDVRDLKGTTYVVVCGSNCSRCTKFEPTLQELANELGDKANFMKLNTSNDKERFRWELVHEAEGGKSKRSSLGFPAIIKVVDGKAVEVLDYHDLGKTVYDTAEMTKLLDSKIEGEIDSSQKTATTQKEKSTTNNQVLKTTSKNVKENIYDQEGITYVQFTNTGCSMCKGVTNAFKELAKTEGDNANFVSVNYSEDSKLFFELLKKAGWTEDTAPLPMVVKYVDGKPVELLSRRDLDTKKINYRKSDSVVNYFKNDIAKTELSEKTTETKAEEKTVEDATNKEAELAEDNKTENNKVMTLKQKLEKLKTNLEIINEFQETIITDSLENAISSAISISGLKEAIAIYSSNLDFQLQLNLSSAISEFQSDDDLDAAKEALLKML